jgi:hypothetical protein
MEPRTTHAYLGIAVTAAGAFGVAALALQRWRAWTALGIVCFFIVAAIVLAVMTYLDRPRIFIGQPHSSKAIFNWPLQESSFSADYVTFTTAHGGTTPDYVPESRAVRSETRPIVYLHVWNEPRRAASTRYAHNVHLTLTFRIGEEVLHKIVGRWSDLDQRDAPETYTNPRDRDVPPNGNRYRIDVAASLDDGLFAMNDRARLGGFKVFPLGPGPVSVEVSARGVGLLRANSLWTLQVTDGALELRTSRALPVRL